MNTFGERLRLTTFGESHGEAIGGVIDGYPAGIAVDFDLLRRRMDERRPGKAHVSRRKEEDRVEILSGINEEGVTLGTPIGFMIRNTDPHPSDYEKLRDICRPNHADFTYQKKYGIRDHRGGGRASARETACRVAAGALAEQFLALQGISVEAFLWRVGGVGGTEEEMMEEVERVRKELDSVGGIVSCKISGVSVGMGNPLYDKLSARLAYAMMSINASKGFEIGDGFAMSDRKGSEVLDAFYTGADGIVRTRTNHNGGLLGGISDGMPIEFKVAFKPTPTIGLPVPVLTVEGEEREETIAGRHDPCVAVRAVPVVRAMACLVVADYLV